MNKDRRRQVKEKFLNYLVGKSCFDCGNEDIRILTFDHLDPSKKKQTVSYLVSKGHPWSVIMDEIAKTQLVCHNCHVIREEIRSNSRKHQFWMKLQNEE